MADINPAVQGGAGVTGAIVITKAFFNLAQSLGWMAPEDAAAWTTFFNDVVPIAFVWGGVWYVSRRTTNISNPRDQDGVPLSRPGDVPVIAKMETLQTEAIQINSELRKEP